MKKINSYDKILSEKIKQNIIEDYTTNNLSLRKIGSKYNIRSKEYLTSLLKPYIRSLSEATKIAHKNYPSSFKQSDETKQKLRNIRLQFMKNHPEKTAWRLVNESYPEKMFQKYLNERGYSDKYNIVREYSVFPFFIDFAFIDLKLAIEIDGSQHLLPERKLKDKEKDALLTNKGWIVIRISEKLVKTNWEIIDDILSSTIRTINKKITP